MRHTCTRLPSTTSSPTALTVRHTKVSPGIRCSFIAACCAFLAVTGVSVELKKLMAFKDKTVKGLTGGIEHLFKKNGVTYVKGKGSLKVQTAAAGLLRAAPSHEAVLCVLNAERDRGCCGIERRQRAGVEDEERHHRHGFRGKL